MNPPTPTSKTIVVVGDIHSEVPLALEGLTRIEREFGEIHQVLSVGDVGLFRLHARTRGLLSRRQGIPADRTSPEVDSVNRLLVLG